MYFQWKNHQHFVLMLPFLINEQPTSNVTMNCKLLYCSIICHCVCMLRSFELLSASNVIISSTQDEGDDGSSQELLRPTPDDQPHVNLFVALCIEEARIQL